MNEFELIEKYVKGVESSSVVLGAGDDCSIIDYDNDHYLITTSDCLVENIHFRLSDISFKDLGFKSLAVNLSDISAMGGKAQWAQLTLAIPSDVKEESVAQFFNGFYELSEREEISLVGGDLSSSQRDIFINITLMGLVKKNDIKRRSDFKEGDLLCVTGNLGDSGAGLKCLLENKKGEAESRLISRHVRPNVFHEHGQWLALQKPVKGMMDLSDGLLSDLQRLDCGFEVEISDLPLSQEMNTCCEKYGWNFEELALSGGEDYSLLFSCVEREVSSLQSSYAKKFNSNIFIIGKVLKDNNAVIYKKAGRSVEINYTGYSHFK